MGGALPTPTTLRKRSTLWAMLFAMTFPTLAAWSYFLALAGQGGKANVWQQVAYIAGKVIQFGFPLMFLIVVERRIPPARGASKGVPCLRYGLAFGLLVFLLMLGIYFGAVRGTALLRQTPEQLRQKLEQFDMATPARYAALALFIVAAHSLLEEYYWRWFVFGHLRRLMARTPAIALSSLAFMAHHVVVLYVYLPGKFWTAALPFSLAIAVGGAVWAWLYERSGGIWSPWLSHLLVDAGIFVIGWDLLWPISV
ncbi:MAG: CPBP family intramembrane glutamic endopeptidase [Gemmataceae bacterium]